MTDRFLAGLHPGFGTYGIWLSKAGVDVKVAGPAANFILRPDIKVEQIILSGTIVASPGQTVTIAWPAIVPANPYLMIHGNSSSNVTYPCDLSARGAAAPDSNEQNFSPVIYNDRFTVLNQSPDQMLYGYYIAFSRSIGT